MLSDGFNETELEAYRNDILEVDEVQEVKSIKGRYHGSSVFIDVTIVVDANLSLVEAHQICDNVEHHLHKKVFPQYTFTQNQTIYNVFKRLHRYINI